MIGIFTACVLGVPTPEELTLTSAGFWASTNNFPLAPLVISGWLGIYLSDSTLFFLGRHLGSGVFRLPFLRIFFTDSRVRWAECRLREQGVLVCFIGRFLPGLRIPVFATAGALRIKPRIFLVVDALAGMILVLLWIFFGNWIANFRFLLVNPFT